MDVRVNVSGRVERVQLVAPAQYQSQRGAEQYERIVIAELRAGRDPRRAVKEEARPNKTKVPTLAEFSVTFIRDYATTNNEASTLREKQGMLRRHVLPLLGNHRLDEIRAKEIEGYKATRLAMKSRRGTAPAAKTINEELGFVFKMLRTAHEWEIIERVPFLRRLKQPAPDFDFLDFEEAERLLAAAAEAVDPWHVMVPIALMSGLRLGELIALHWDDVDLVRRRLHVRRSMDGRGVLKGTKNNRVRRVDLEQRAVALLKAHKHLRGPFVFCMEDGRPLRHRECESSSTDARGDGPLARICRRAGLRRVGWHSLRHSYASQLVMSGGDSFEVQDLLGHASLAMTQRYTHLSPTARRAAVDLLEARRRGDNLVTTSPKRS